MKVLLAVTLSAFAVSSFAQGDLETHKAKALEHFDKKISMLNEAKSCISGAATMEAFKACKEDHRNKMKAMKKEWKEKMMDKHDHMKDHKKKK